MRNALTQFSCHSVGVDKRPRPLTEFCPMGDCVDGLHLKAGVDNESVIYVSHLAVNTPPPDGPCYELAKGEELFIPVDSPSKVYVFCDTDGEVVQTLALSDTTDTDTFKLRYGGQITSSLDQDAAASDVKAALEALDGISVGDVSASGGPLPAEVTLTFTGDLSGVEVPTLQGVEAGTNEIQTVTVSAPGGGTFTLSLDGVESASIEHDATPAELEAVLSASFGDNVSVSGAVGAWVVEFVDALGSQAQPLMVLDSSGLGSGPFNADVTETVPGAGATNEEQVIHVVAYGGTFTLTYDGSTSGPIGHNSLAGDVETVLEGILGAGNCSVSGPAGDWVVEFTGTLAGTDVELLTLDDSSLEEATPATDVLVLVPGSGAANERQSVIVTSLGGGTFTLTYGTPPMHEYTTDPINHDASPAEVEAALRSALAAAHGADCVSVTGVPGVWEVEFTNGLGLQDVPTLVIDDSGLVTLPVETSVTETVTGDPGTNEQQTVSTDAVGGTFRLYFGPTDTDPIDYDASVAAVEAALAPILGAGNYDVSGAPGAWVVEFQGFFGGQDVELMTIDATNLHGTLPTTDVTETQAGHSCSVDIEKTASAADNYLCIMRA